MAGRRNFDVVMAWAIDRVGRSLIDLLGTIQHLEAVGVDLYLDQQPIDTTTPMGNLVFQVTGAFAEFERSITRQRIKAGLKHAIAQGARLGRPKVDIALERKAQKQLKTLEGRQDAWTRDWNRTADQAGNENGVVAHFAAAPARRCEDAGQRCFTNLSHEASHHTANPGSAGGARRARHLP
jgi:DNA invertase Pin-like site-specific DNA recombinase